ncbi:MAG: M48 family metallopeptidase [Halobacteriaceae archaeon]
MKKAHIGQVKVPYNIEWTDRTETIGISLQPDMELIVRAPQDATLKEVEDTLEEKKEWILGKISGFQEEETPPREKEFLSGEKLLFKGRRYLLKANEKPVEEPKLKFEKGKFWLEHPSYSEESERRESVRETVVSWYRENAGNHLLERVNKYTPELDVQPDSIHVEELPRTWGKYSNGEIYFNWRLILAPQRIQDYVIVHELAHMQYQDHSEFFWNTVGSIIPDYKDRREWLRIHGNRLNI